MQRLGVVALACCALIGCRGPHRSKGERLAQVYCAACHMFPEPGLLDKQTWRTGVLPQMAQRLGVPQPSLPAQPQLDPPLFATGPFVRRLQSSAIITLLKTDSVNQRIFIGEAATNTFRVFDFNRRLEASLTLASPPTDVISEKDRLLVLESGRLEPNDDPKGTLVQYDVARDGSLHFSKVLIDSLFRPVFVKQFAFAGDGRKDFVICEFGNNRGR